MTYQDFCNIKNIAIHDGAFHSDDVFAIAMLQIINPNINYIRTRDTGLLLSADMRVDVGGKYNYNTNDFDHHQIGFDERNIFTNSLTGQEYEGPKLCGFGLIFRHFHQFLIAKVILQIENSSMDIDTFITENNKLIKYIADSIRRSIVMPIDAEDNGETKRFSINNGYNKAYAVGRIISRYNPVTFVGKQQDYITESDAGFIKGTTLAKDVIVGEITAIYSAYKGSEEVGKLVKQLPDDGILILPQFIPYNAYFSENKDKTSKVKYIIFPNTGSGGWMIRTPYYNSRFDHEYTRMHANGIQRTYRAPFPVSIRGITDLPQFEKITGVDKVTFVHPGGFIASAETQEAAHALALWSINNQDE